MVKHTETNSSNKYSSKLTFPPLCISERIKIKINFNFYFHISLRFYEGL